MTGYTLVAACLPGPYNSWIVAEKGTRRVETATWAYMMRTASISIMPWRPMYLVLSLFKSSSQTPSAVFLNVNRTAGEIDNRLPTQGCLVPGAVLGAGAVSYCCLAQTGLPGLP